MNILKILNDIGLQKLSDETLNTLAKIISDERKRRSKATNCQNFNSSKMIKDIEKTFGKFKPSIKFHEKSHNQRVFETLLNADWTCIYESNDDPGEFYVYIHHFPSKRELKYSANNVSIDIPGLPFYIGKGSGNRAYDLKRNQGHGEIIKNLVNSGSTAKDIVTIVASGLTEQKALEIESKLIYFFGTQYEADRKGLLVNLDIPKRPF